MSVKVHYLVHHGKIVRAVHQLELPDDTPVGKTYAEKLYQLAEWCNGTVREDFRGIDIETPDGVQSTKPGDWIVERQYNDYFRRCYPCHPKLIDEDYTEVEFDIHPRDWVKTHLR